MKQRASVWVDQGSSECFSSTDNSGDCYHTGGQSAQQQPCLDSSHGQKDIPETILAPCFN